MMKKQKGFTIVELMIATSVFAVVLLLIATAVLQIGKSYYKGLNEARTSGVMDTITNEISQAIEFSGQNIQPDLTNVAYPDTHGICIGRRMYTYKTGQAVSGSNHGLVAYDADNCDSSKLVDPNTAMSKAHPHELLASGMRVTRLNVVPGGESYRITVGVINSPDDLICDRDDHTAGAVSNCAVTDDNTASNVKAAIQGGKNLGCKLRSDSQFCTVSQLSTTVVRRI